MTNLSHLNQESEFNFSVEHQHSTCEGPMKVKWAKEHAVPNVDLSFFFGITWAKKLLIWQILDQDV